MNTTNIPAELRSVAQWVNWRNENGNKVPYHPRGFKASKTNPDHWSSFDAVVAAEAKFTGIGFVFTRDDDFLAVDLDGCRNPASCEIDPWARNVITSLNSYSEVSPSLNGVKIIAKGASPFDSGRKFGIEVPDRHGKTPGLEIYDHAVYFTITGARLRGMHEIREVDSADLAELINVLPIKRDQQPTGCGPSVVERGKRYVARMPAAVSGQRGHDTTFRVACVLMLGFALSVDEAFSILEEYNERCDPPWSERELRHKLESAAKQPGERGYLRDARESEWSTIVLPDYTNHRDAKLSRDKQPVRITPLRDHVTKYVQGLENDPTFSPYPTGIDALDDRLGGGLCIGNLNVVGARTGEGKTMLGLQLCYELARQGLTTLVISEEMHEAKLSRRLLQFASDIPSSRWLGSEEELKHAADRHFDRRAGIYTAFRLRRIGNVRDAIRQACQELGVQVILVDYVQRLDGPGGHPTAIVSNVATELGTITRECQVMTIALCQVGREIAKAARNAAAGGLDKLDVEAYIPTKSDLKQSGRIEEEADVVIMGMWVRGAIANYPYPGDYLLRVDKVRDSGTDKRTIFCRFEGERMRIAESETAMEF